MKLPKSVVAVAAIGAFALSSCSQEASGEGGLSSAEEGSAADFPSQQIELIVPFEPGGGADFTGRTIAEHLQDELDVNITVVNQGGGGGQVGATALMNEEADGYTVGLLSSTPLTVYPTLRETAYEFDTFVPIVRAAVTRQIFQVSEDAEWESFDEFLEYAKANPGEVTYGTGGVGTTAHLAMELFQREAGIELEHVPYDGLGTAKTEVMGGNVDAAVGPITGADEGRLRGLFSLSDEQGRTPDDIPLAIDEGVDASLNVVHYIVGPPGLPEEQRTILADALETTLTDDATIEAFEASDIEISYSDSSTAEAELAADYEEMAELLPELDLDESQ